MYGLSEFQQNAEPLHWGGFLDLSKIGASAAYISCVITGQAKTVLLISMTIYDLEKDHHPVYGLT